LVPQPASHTTLASGTVLSKRFRIDKLIGSGGYANVYRATDLTFGYERAIKEVTDPDPGVRNQFRLEAELLINSRHPNIPHGYHLIEDMGRLYLVMDYVTGKDLEELLNESLTQHKKPLDEAQVLKWAMEICDALVQMHELNVPVIHRDIKPANIKIMPDGRPILIDFGLAKLQQQSGPTMTAAQGVSPGFAPPEQYMAKGRTDARTDIYGLGATLYACLTGKDPPEAPGRLLAQTGAGSGGMRLMPVRRLYPSVSEATDRLVQKALELSPNNRQQSAGQLREELQAALRQLESSKGEGTLIMGVTCNRCGTQNRPGTERCTNCRAPLRATAGPSPFGAPGPTSGGTGKRAVVGPPAGLRSTGKQVAVGGMRSLPPDEDEPRTGRQVALRNQRSGKQPAVGLDQRTGRQRALVPAGDGPAAAGATALAAAVPGIRGAGAMAPLPTKAGRAVENAKANVALAEPAGGKATAESGWIRLGTVPLTGFGKTMLVLSALETLWGACILALGGIAIAFRGQAVPAPQLAVGWLIVVVFGSLLGAQAIIRPVYRRGRLTPLRRWMQGIGLALYSGAVHGVAVWGATIFASQQGNATLALISFILFGVNVLVVGVLAVINTLG
jgi:serine/threonine-protein kinase